MTLGTEPMKPWPGFAGASLRLERAGDMATIWLANPERRNALDLASTTELEQATALCSADRSINIIIVRSTDDAFSVGGDIDEFNNEQGRIEAHILDITARFHRAILHLTTARAVSIAVVEGVAAGAGFALALSCDLLIASTNARFTAAYSRLGFSSDGGASYFLTQKLGTSRAFELLALNGLLDAEEALRTGLATRLATPGTAQAAVDAVVAGLRSATPDSLAHIKTLVAAAPQAEIAAHLDAERAAIARLAASPEAQLRIRSFVSARNSAAAS